MGTEQPCPLDRWIAEPGHSQALLSEKSGVPESSISFFRSRTRGLRIDSIKALALATGISAESLLLWMSNLDEEKPARSRRGGRP